MAKRMIPSRHDNLVPRLLAAGCPMPLANVSESRRDVIIKVIKPEITIAYDRKSGTEYVFGVQVRNVSYSVIEPRRYGARIYWRASLHWLVDPRIYTPQTKVYRLDGSKREFPCSEVLNHRTGRNGRLGPGQSMEGVLLAFAMSDRIPPYCLHGTIAPARLFVEDQFGRKHWSEIDLSIDRRATMKPLVLGPRPTSLFQEEELKTARMRDENLQPGTIVWLGNLEKASNGG